MRKSLSPVYRVSLSKGATAHDRLDYLRRVEFIRTKKTNWKVVSDWPRPGESEAVVILRKDQNYAQHRAGYAIATSLFRALAGSY